MMSSKKKTQINLQIEDKKHKKSHKHHRKHHKRQDNDSDDDCNSSQLSDKSQTPLKLTIKIGGQTLGEKSVFKSSIRALNTVSNRSVDEEENEDIDDEYDLSMNFDEEEDNLEIDEENEINDSEEPDEEEVWFDALEEGRLHEVDDELKKIRDPKLMTARQRALLENKSLKRKSDALKMMASQSQESNTIMSEEMIQRKMLRDRRRRQQAEEKKEKDKKQTIDRLLRKRQELARDKKKKKQELPKITYKNSQNGIFICLPNGIPFELMSQSIANKSLPMVGLKCARNGCSNDKKYTCSKTKLPVCSLQCYKQINK